MTGQILAGLDPLEAVKYQTLLMFLISGGSGLSALAVSYLTAWHPLCLYALSTEAHDPGNKGLLVGQKKPLEPKHVWSIRVRLEIAQRRWGKVALSRRRLFPCVFGELRKRLLERHFSPAGFAPVLADGLSQSFSMALAGSC
jgi:Uncharacterised protein family (UPF0014)